MNKFKTLILLVSLFSVPAVQAADEEDHTAHHPDAAQGEAAPAADTKAPGAGMGKMHENMKKMEDLMSKILSTSDPQERKKLMEEHMQSMQDGMKGMKGMSGMKMGMMGGKKPSGMDEDDAEEPGNGVDEDEHGSAGKSEKGAMKGKCKMMEDGKKGGMMGGMMKMHKMMEVRMDMMQKMMDQMLQHEQAEQEMERGR